VRRPGAALPQAALAIHDVHQEHGLVGRRDGGNVDFAAYPPGSRLLVLPNHSCMTAAMYDRYYVIDPAIGDGQAVVAEWDRVNGW
jgi:D-serine deaminase-like pyridoxal phosphate-dependent protein